jgi:hypothetical protein
MAHLRTGFQEDCDGREAVGTAIFDRYQALAEAPRLIGMTEVMYYPDG